MWARVMALLLGLLVLGGVARAEPDPLQRHFEVRLIAHFQQAIKAVDQLEADKVGPDDPRWAEALGRVLGGADAVLRLRPGTVTLEPARQKALEAWTQAHADTRAVYQKLRDQKQPADGEGPTLRTRARGLLRGYRNACRTARTALATPELETAAEAFAAYFGIKKEKLEAHFDQAGAHEICRLAAAHTRRILAIHDPTAATVLAKAGSGDVLLIEGAFDRAGRVLNDLRVRYRKISEYDARKQDFRGPRVVIWSSGEGIPPPLRKRVIKKLRTFVQRGGYLYTTDWGLVHVVQELLPGAFKSRAQHGQLPEMVLPPRAAPAAANHPLLRGVFLPDVKAKWWLEQHAFDVEIGPRDVKGRVVLAEIEALKVRLERGSVAAVTFPFGKGHVLHVLPQAYQQQGNLAGVMAQQRLLLNFLVAGLRDGA